MAQIKIYGLKEHLDPIKDKLSNMIHSCVVEALSFPRDKRAHRFFPLEAEDFYYPAGRTPRYTIVEISMLEGRSVETKKTLIRLLFERTQRELDLAPADLEVTITFFEADAPPRLRERMNRLEVSPTAKPRGIMYPARRESAHRSLITECCRLSGVGPLVKHLPHERESRMRKPSIRTPTKTK